MAMTTSEAKAEAKSRLEDFLYMQGIQNTRKNFHCLFPDHADKNPSMAYYAKTKTVKCFSCGRSGDIFDLVSAIYGVEGAEIFNKTYELLGFDVEGFKPARQSRNNAQQGNNTKMQTRTQTANSNSGTGVNAPDKRSSEIKMLVQQAYENRFASDYFQRRGISRETADRFRLGYAKLYGKMYAVIPTGQEYANYNARNTDPNADKKDRFKKPAGKNSEIWNLQALEQEKPVAVVEGEIDGLTLEELGYRAIAIGGLGIKNLIKLLEQRKKNGQNVPPLLISLDPDEAGNNAENELFPELAGLDIPFYQVHIRLANCKDANESLLADRKAFQQLTAAIFAEPERYAEEKGEIAKETYRKEKEADREDFLKTAASYQMQAFINGITASANTPKRKTGFRKLDNELDGGLYEGLYVVGALSSLGKTTLILQIADQLAQQGHDVLIFSLEMAQNELIAKSISRHTFQISRRLGIKSEAAKTVRGITDGERWKDYSRQEIELITAAMNEYYEYSSHIFVREGVGDIGAKQVRDEVERYINCMGQTPVVIVDYIQILAGADPRLTDKQKTDGNVLELKRLSRDFKLPVIAISSVNRASYNSPVNMGMLKDTGNLEYGADCVFGLQFKGVGSTDFDENKARKEVPREIELVILKNRNGATGGKVPFLYNPIFNYYEEV